MAVTSLLRLIEGSVAPARESRHAIVTRMAGDLIKYDAFQNETDAIRSLMSRGYSPFDVLRFVDDARQAAMQRVVAREMSRP